MDWRRRIKNWKWNWRRNRWNWVLWAMLRKGRGNRIFIFLMRRRRILWLGLKMLGGHIWISLRKVGISLWINLLRSWRSSMLSYRLIRGGSRLKWIRWSLGLIRRGCKWMTRLGLRIEKLRSWNIKPLIIRRLLPN